MKTVALIAVLLVAFVDCQQLEILTVTEDPDLIQSRGRLGRILVTVGAACSPNGAFFCADSDPCKTGAGAKRAFRDKCTAKVLAAGVGADACPVNQYCYEPNPASPGNASCTSSRPAGCNAIPTVECAGLADAGKKFCYNSSPCVQQNSIITCTAAGGPPATNLGGVGGGLSCDNAAQGLVGCQDNVGGQPKCIKQVPYYCPNAVSYMCSGSGYYPHPTNCNEYYQCSANGATADAILCPNGQVFDPMANKNGNPCRVNTRTGSNCIVAQCTTGALNVLLNYPGFAKNYGSYAVSCINPQSVYRCEDGFGPDLQSYPVTCTGVCNGGIKKTYDPSNPSGYYTCAYNGAQYVGTQQVCENNALFNKVTKLCVPGTVG